jgi:hypothetical protein
MTLSAQHFITLILWLAPVIQTAAALGLLALAAAFRRNLGPHRRNTGPFIAAGSLMLLLHAGYFLAPMWWNSGRCLLGAATMLPIALLVLGALVVAATQTELLRDVARWELPQRLAVIAGAGVLVLAYLGPLVLMLAASA